MNLIKLNALAIMVISMAFPIAASAASSPGMPPSMTYGGYDTTDYVNGYTGDESYEDGYSYDAYSKQVCKTAHAVRYFKSWIGFKVWQYHEDVRFCFNGTKLTYVNRVRYAEFLNGGGYFWNFDGHVGSSCGSESCSDQVGQSSGYFFSQGRFHACWVAGFTVCSEKLPWVAISVNALGGVVKFNTGGS